MSEVVADVARRFNARRSGKGYIAKCPAHDDRKPSLSIDEGVDGRALVICRAGCALNLVLSAAGLTINDLFPAPTRQPSKNGARFDWEACMDASQMMSLNDSRIGAATRGTFVHHCAIASS